MDEFVGIFAGIVLTASLAGVIYLLCSIIDFVFDGDEVEHDNGDGIF